MRNARRKARARGSRGVALALALALGSGCRESEPDSAPTPDAGSPIRATGEPEPLPPTPPPEPPKVERPPEPKAPRPIADRGTREAAPIPAPEPERGPAPGGGSAARPLDLAALEARLRETPALGLLTKLSLKNEIDDLLDDVRRFHDAGRGSLEALRVRYDLLVLKVMSLLQDDEPALAREIDLSREALWALLADPKGLDRGSVRGTT